MVSVLLKIYKVSVITGLSILTLWIAAVNAVAQVEPLDQYIDRALESNLALQQKQFSLEKSMAALDQARGAFLPSITLSSRYSRAGGGRDIIIPIGDLVNPVHEGLNDLIGSNVYPANLNNEVIPFLREEEHETKIRVTQPLFQPAVYYNYRLQSNLRRAEAADRDRFARQLVADVKTAYYNYIKADTVVAIYAATEELLRENLRVSQRLFDNDIVTRDAVYRAEAELSDIIQKRMTTEKDVTLAASYFNFLLNRPLDAAIETPQSAALPEPPVMDIATAGELALERREELLQLEYGIAASDYAVNISRTRFLPGVSLAFDYGFEGTTYEFDEQSDFWMASFVLEWNLFNGFQDKARMAQAKADRRIRRAQKSETIKQITIQVQDAFLGFEVARQSLQTAADQQRSARSSFHIVERKYNEGMVSQTEYLDARAALTRAEINMVVTIFDYLTRHADLERVIGTYTLPERNG